MADQPVNLTDEELALVADDIRKDPSLLNTLDSDTRRRWTRLAAAPQEDTIVGMDTSPAGRAARINKNLAEQQSITGATLLGMPQMGQAVSAGLGLLGKGANAAAEGLAKFPWYARSGIGHLITGPLGLPAGSGAAAGAVAPAALRGAGSVLQGAGKAGQYILGKDLESAATDAAGGMISAGAQASQAVASKAPTAGGLSPTHIAALKEQGYKPDTIARITQTLGRGQAPPPTAPASAPSGRPSLPLVDKVEGATASIPIPSRIPPRPPVNLPTDLPDLAGTDLTVTGEEAAMAARWLKQGVTPDQIVRRILAGRQLAAQFPDLPTGSQVTNAVLERNAGTRMNQWNPVGSKLPE